MRKLTFGLALVSILLPFSLGNQFCLSGTAFGAGFNRLTNGESAIRPTVNNGRILWCSSYDYAVTVKLYDGTTTQTIVTDADVVYTGPPDLDEQGNVAYVKKVGTAHQVFLYDGTTHTQLTDNPDIQGSPNIGLGTDQGITGWPRVSNKHVVFRDVDGNVFLYNPNRQTIRQINQSGAQTANVKEGNPLSWIPDQKIFEFNGTSIVWFHEVVTWDGFTSEMTIYLAKPPYKDPPKKVHVFYAWTPGENFPITGVVVDPFFVACGDQVAWQYIPPTHLIPEMPGYRLSSNDTIIGYNDGKSDSFTLIRPAGPVSIRSIRIHDGQVAWSEAAPDPINAELVFLFNGTSTSRVGLFKDPIPNAKPAGARCWWSTRSVDINHGQVAWLAMEYEYEEFVPDYIVAMPTYKLGLFTSSSGKTPVAVMQAPLGGGISDFDSGLYAFVGHVNSGSDVFTYPVIEIPAGTNAILRLNDTKKEPSPVSLGDEDKIAVADCFKLSVSGNCGETNSEGVEITAMKFSGEAISGINANLADVESVQLFRDLNIDGDFTDELLLGEGTFVDSNVTLSLDSPIVLPPGGEEHFVLVFDLNDTVCPCNKYKSFLVADDIEATTIVSQTVPLKRGSSAGRVVLPEPKFGMFSEEEMFGGDDQANFVEAKLPEKLGIRVENFPIKCGEATFEISSRTGVGISNATLIGPDGNSPRVTFPFVQDDKDAVAEVEMILGDRKGLYAVEAGIKFTDSDKCDSPEHLFRERAGRIVMEVVDAGNPQFYDATKKASADPPTWEVTSSADFENKLSYGGQAREATSTDGCSMLLIRAELLEFADPPPGDVEFTLSGEGDLGTLTPNFGIVIPPSTGSRTAKAEWKKTKCGIIAFALYTPPINFADRDAATRKVTITVQYSLPTDPENIQEATADITLHRPPILFVHGMWSDKTTWGPAYMREDPRYLKECLDYSGGVPSGNSRSFSEQGHVIRNWVRQIVGDRRKESIATTQVVVVAHSMGGLLTRQFIADEGGFAYRRPDNFGQGDIYKFITMGTPHWGSPLGWLMKNIRDDKPAVHWLVDPALRFLVMSIVDGFSLDIDSGAIDAMCPGSPELQNLGVSVVPNHTIKAWCLDTGETDISLWGFFSTILQPTIDIRKGGPIRLSPWVMLLSAMGYMTDVATSLLYASDKTDILVTNTSQVNGYPPAAYTSIFDKTIHMSVGTNLSPFLENETDSEFIADRVFELIEAPVDGPFAQSLSAPRVQDAERQCVPATTSTQGRLFEISQPEETPQDDIIILYPLDRQVVHPGETVTVTVQEPANSTLASALFLSLAQTVFSSQAPHQADIVIPENTVGEFPVVVVGKDHDGGLHVSSIKLCVEQVETLEFLNVLPAPLYMSQNSKVSLRVDGEYSDGISRNLTSAKTGTFYQSWDENIATVDENGTVEARAEGKTFILVSNGMVDQIVTVRTATAD